MLRHLGLALVMLALFSIAGGHWAVVQTVAWAEMLHDYAQRTGSVALAVEQTFDGQHPCEICLKIAAAKQAETLVKSTSSKSLPLQVKVVKADKQAKALLPGGVAAVPMTVVGPSDDPTQTEVRAISRDDQPLTPPPRVREQAV